MLLGFCRVVNCPKIHYLSQIAFKYRFTVAYGINMVLDSAFVCIKNECRCKRAHVAQLSRNGSCENSSIDHVVKCDKLHTMSKLGAAAHVLHDLRLENPRITDPAEIL